MPRDRQPRFLLPGRYAEFKERPLRATLKMGAFYYLMMVPILLVIGRRPGESLADAAWTWLGVLAFPVVVFVGMLPYAYLRPRIGHDRANAILSLALGLVLVGAIYAMAKYMEATEPATSR